MEEFDLWRASSPYYNEDHEQLSKSLRTFVARELAPHVDEWESAGIMPREAHRKAGEAGIFGLGFPEQYGGVSEGINTFHKLVLVDELAQLGSGGITACLLSHTIGLPPLIELGHPDLREEVVPKVISGEAIISFAVTEPSGGSDVAALKTRAEKVGSHYVVNGSKTYITNGIRADYLLAAVRTGGPGMGGLSLLIIPTNTPGIERTSLKKMGLHSSDTATIHFDDVRVPVENLIGAENGGFKSIMKNFNSERLMAAQMASAFSRAALKEAVDWAAQRETFGQKLGHHQAIRMKLADMVRHIRATQAWIDLCTWQYDNGMVSVPDLSLLKVQSTQTFENVVREASQVLGGVSVIRGSVVERLWREVRIAAIAGGSEEIMLDMAGRQFRFGGDPVRK